MQINQQKPNTPQNVPQVQEQEKPKRPEPNLVLKLPLTDEQIIEQLLKMERSYKDLSPEHKSKKNIIEAATYIDANNVKHLPKDIDIIFNESFISKLVRANGYVLTIGLKEKILPDYYKDDKLLWLDAISNSPELIKQLPHNLLNTDKEIHNFLKAGIVRNPDIYKFLANEFKGNKLIALSLINTNQGARYFEEIPEQLRMDQTFFQQALALNGELFKYVKDKSNTSLILTAVASDSSIIRDVPLETLRNPILQKDLIQTSINARREMITRGITISKVAEDAYQNMKFAYDTLSIDLRMRDKNSQTVDVKYFDNSKEIIRNRYAVSNENTKEKLENLLGKEYFAHRNTKPLAVVLYPRFDGEVFNQNKALERDCLDRLCNTHKVVFYQVGNNNDITSSFTEATGNKKELVNLLLLGGHGDPYSILLDEQSQLTIFDTDFHRRARDFMDDNSTVILNSCSTGGKSKSYGYLNIATFLSGIWPQANIIAPTKDTYQAQINTSLDGEFNSAFYENSEGHILPLIIPKRNSKDLNFINEKEDQRALVRIYELITQQGGYFYFSSRHGVSCNFLGLESAKSNEAINGTLWERNALADILALKIEKNLIDIGGISKLREKGKTITNEELEDLSKSIIKSLNLKEEGYQPLFEINDIEKQVSIKLKLDSQIIYFCRFNYDNLMLIRSEISNPRLLSEIDK